MNRYEIAYDMVMDIQREAMGRLMDNTGFIKSDAVKLLSATYVLQDYLAGEIAMIGETPEGEDVEGITWERIKEVLKEYERGFVDET